MQAEFQITLSDIFKAEVAFFKNSYLLDHAKGNFSYILWYDEEKGRVVCAKSKVKARITNLSYISTYRSIEEYYKKDLSFNKEHLLYFEDGLFEEIEKFFKKFGKYDLLSELMNEKDAKFEQLEQEKLLRQRYEEIRKEKEIEMMAVSDDSVKEEKINAEFFYVEVKTHIMELIKKGEKIVFPEETLSSIQEKIYTTQSFTRTEVDVYAKNLIKMFWENNYPTEKELDEVLNRVINIDLRRK